MINRTLLKALESLHTSTPEAAMLLSNLFVPISFKGGTSFPWYEQASHVLYFVECGLVRGYLYWKNEEHTCWVMEHGFLLPVNQSFTETELEYTEFMRDSTGWMLNLERALPQMQRDPTVCRMLFEIFQRNIEMGKMRELTFKLRSRDERFRHMFDLQKQLMDKIPHVILASLLSVTPKYLYELKKKYR
ncbi:hypothetical protein HDC92_004957 [Pedobacter sp. AK017]|uniref:hypothetical protein n=1 Tax=Pedobacter sp. AK017 TaxID=2723073 RepID=UPI001614D0EC|nr:hypothetical protein [Pedobacter sp. AK017]MBB5441250.1 hypothetical protein [Pedobacter sp. AK017]